MKMFFLLLIIPFSVSCSPQKKDLKLRSQEIFEDIRKLKYAEVNSQFDSALAHRTDTTRLRRLWENIQVLAGPYQQVLATSVDHEENSDVVIQHCQFQKKKIDFKLIFANDGKIKGISFLPGEKHDVYVLPPYNKPDAYVERDIAIQNTIYHLPGILTVPNKQGKFPVVIMVHGAGANDKDETVGPLKIFKDMAIGLAEKGVAVYRYEKRTRVYRGRMMRNIHFTVEEETISDAIAAVNVVKGDSSVDTNAIYVCGHSLGGMLLPRIAAKANGIKGLIYLAANARPIEDLLLEQAKYLVSIDTSGADNKMLIDSMTREVKRVKSLKSTDPDSVFVLRIPAPYWNDLNNYDPVKSAQALNNKMLFLHGARDYQVTETDFNLWKKAMLNKNATFKLYPSLNHFFVKGIGKSKPAEYDKAGNVDVEVINDIANWIAGRK